MRGFEIRLKSCDVGGFFEGFLYARSKYLENLNEIFGVRDTHRKKKVNQMATDSLDFFQLSEYALVSFSVVSNLCEKRIV
jgi:hypothetical protein